MVKLNRISTRTGDDGTTGLVGGIRVGKDDPRVEAYGCVDEANATIGLALEIASRATTQRVGERAIAAILRSVQHDLFDVGADLATPVVPDPKAQPLRITAAQTDRLDPIIDCYADRLGPLTSFVLPGGTALAASLHLARTVVRRAERRAVSLHAAQPESTSPEPIRYLNRLSDLLFVLARAANDLGERDVLWVPGASRE